MIKTITLLCLVLLVTAETGCAPVRRPPSGIAVAVQQKDLPPAGDSAKGTGGDDTGDAAPPKGRSGKDRSARMKQRRIPPLEERLAKIETGAYVVHGVAHGETLSEITMTYYGTCSSALLETLKKTNGIEETDAVQAGWNLILPTLTVDGELRPTGGTAPDIRHHPTPRYDAHGPAAPGGSGADQKTGAVPEEKAAAETPDALRFRQGIASFEKKDYPAAYDAFAAVSGDGGRCGPCGDYLKEIEARAALHFEKGLAFFRKRSYDKALREIEKARIPPIEPQTREYLFKSHFEIALKKFLEYKRSGNRSRYDEARQNLEQARGYRADCPGCLDYEEIFKKTHYNNGIRYFTASDGEDVDKAVQEWEKVRFVDPAYKDVVENIAQAEDLLRKLKRIKKVS